MTDERGDLDVLRPAEHDLCRVAPRGGACIALAAHPEHLRNMGIVDRLFRRRQHFDMATVDAPMALLRVFTEAPGSLFPWHGCQRLVGLGTVLLDGQQIVGAMLLDDAGGGVAGGVQRIEGEQRAADGDHLQQCSDRRKLAIVVVKVETRQRHPGGVLDQRRCLVAQRAVAIGTANPLAVGGQRLPLLLMRPWCPW